jgi:GNAT superfamily N-acetyltransferase
MSENFDRWPDQAILEFVSTNQSTFASDFSEHFLAQYKAAIEDGHVSIEKRSYGFAIVRHEGRVPKNPRLILEPESELAILYISEKFRGHQLAKQLLGEIVAKYVRQHPMLLSCEGEERRRIFECLGFNEISQEDGWSEMALTISAPVVNVELGIPRS